MSNNFKTWQNPKMKSFSQMNSQSVACAIDELRTPSSAAWQLACKNWPMVLRSLILSQAHLPFTLEMRPQNCSQRRPAGKKRTLGGIQPSKQQFLKFWTCWMPLPSCWLFLAEVLLHDFTWTRFDCNFSAAFWCCWILLGAVCCWIWMSIDFLVSPAGWWVNPALWTITWQ